MQVELIYEKTCPNIAAARVALLHAFADAGVSPRWQEWEVSSEDAPAHVHGFGSPTILVNGEDVSGEKIEGDDLCCRIYAHDEHANKGVPAVSAIAQAIQSAQTAATQKSRFSRFKFNGATLSAAGMALLPKLTCPACWPAYAGVLSAMGIGFFDYTPYLLPLTAGFLVIAVASLAYRAQQRRGYKPLLLGLFAAALLLIGKFYYSSDSVMYAGLALLVLASLWNTWPQPGVKGACPACEPATKKVNI
jgi:mercuric ion transport protein